MDLKQVNVDRIQVAQDRSQWRAFVNMVIYHRDPQKGKRIYLSAKKLPASRERPCVMELVVCSVHSHFLIAEIITLE
jgi:hypothetical protein